MRSTLNNGTWHCESSRTVVMQWNLMGFVDRLTISSDGRTLTGTNNLGHALRYVAL